MDGETQPVGSVPFRFGGRFVLRFDDHRGTARCGNQHVGMAARVVGEGLGILGAHLAARQHAAEQVSQGIVGVGFSLARHIFCGPLDSCPNGDGRDRRAIDKNTVAPTHLQFPFSDSPRSTQPTAHCPTSRIGRPGHNGYLGFCAANLSTSICLPRDLACQRS